MKKYTVTATIVSGNLDNGVPCPVSWYSGTDLAAAMAAMVSAAARDSEALSSKSGLPERELYRTLSVTLDIMHEVHEAPPSALDPDAARRAVREWREWETDRVALTDAEDGPLADAPRADDWHASDDSAVDLMRRMAAILTAALPEHGE